MHPTRIIIFDGDCRLCAALVQLVHRHDRQGVFLFVSAQSASGRAIQSRLRINALESGTLILVKDDRALTRSDALVEIARHLDGAWKLGALFTFMPRRLRDALYAFVVAHRHRWKGRHGAGPPSPCGSGRPCGL